MCIHIFFQSMTFLISQLLRSNSFGCSSKAPNLPVSSSSFLSCSIITEVNGSVESVSKSSSSWSTVRSRTGWTDAKLMVLFGRPCLGTPELVIYDLMLQEHPQIWKFSFFLTNHLLLGHHSFSILVWFVALLGNLQKWIWRNCERIISGSFEHCKHAFLILRHCQYLKKSTRPSPWSSKYCTKQTIWCFTDISVTSSTKMPYVPDFLIFHYQCIYLYSISCLFPYQHLCI